VHWSLTIDNGGAMMMIVKMGIVLLLVIIHVLCVLYVLRVCVINFLPFFLFFVAENNKTTKEEFCGLPFQTEKI
jgi:hypothetical protein|tara:strand:- start:279 stop:500 length:222 start_codon:yes stop_codon:yes gene_type:complete